MICALIGAVQCLAGKTEQTEIAGAEAEWDGFT